MCEHDETEEHIFHTEFWAKMQTIAKLSLITVVIIWSFMTYRFLLLFKTRYEYVSNLMIILALPLVFTVMSYFSIHHRNNNGHLDLIRGFYEVFLLFGVFGLMKNYVAYDSEAGMFRPDVLYEAIREHQQVSMFSPPERLHHSKGWIHRAINRVKHTFHFSLKTTQEAKQFVQHINDSLWIFGAIRLVTLLVDLLTQPPEWLTLCLETVGVIAMTVAIGYNYMFVHVIEKEIEICKATRKFWSVKIFLSLTFYQGYILHWCLFYDYSGGWEYVEENIKNDIIIWTGDALICIEMILFCGLLAWCFPYSSFKDHEISVGTQLAKKYLQQQPQQGYKSPKKKEVKKTVVGEQEIELFVKKPRYQYKPTNEDEKSLIKKPLMKDVYEGN